MARDVTAEEMASRKRMARAKCAITAAMSEYLKATPKTDHLTAVEWIEVLHECSQRMIGRALGDEWSDKS